MVLKCFRNLQKMAFKVFNTRSFQGWGDMPAPASTPNLFQRYWAQKNLYLELALNVAKLLLGEKLPFTFLTADRMLSKLRTSKHWGVDYIALSRESRPVSPSSYSIGHSVRSSIPSSQSLMLPWNFYLQ